MRTNLLGMVLCNSKASPWGLAGCDCFGLVLCNSEATPWALVGASGARSGHRGALLVFPPPRQPVVNTFHVPVCCLFVDFLILHAKGFSLFLTSCIALVEKSRG